MKKIDILVAVRNESENIIKFVDQIKNINIKGIEISIVFLEDGSTDDTLTVLRKLAKEFNFVNYFSLKNDLGQYAALFFGMNNSDSDAVITMDVDGGHPLNIIKKMVNEFQNGYNVVQGHRVQYKQKEKYRAVASYLYNLFFLVFIGVDILKQNSIFRLLDRKAAEIFKTNFHWGHYLRTNFKKSDNIRINYISYDTPEREYGVSKYNFMRLARLSIRGIYSQLSKERFIFYILILLSSGIMSLTYKSYFIFTLCIILFALLIIPYLSLRRVNPITRIKILEANYR